MQRDLEAHWRAVQVTRRAGLDSLPLSRSARRWAEGEGKRHVSARALHEGGDGGTPLASRASQTIEECSQRSLIGSQERAKRLPWLVWQNAAVAHNLECANPTSRCWYCMGGASGGTCTTGAGLSSNPFGLSWAALILTRHPMRRSRRGWFEGKTARIALKLWERDAPTQKEAAGEADLVPDLGEDRASRGGRVHYTHKNWPQRYPSSQEFPARGSGKS